MQRTILRADYPSEPSQLSHFCVLLQYVPSKVCHYLSISCVGFVQFSIVCSTSQSMNGMDGMVAAILLNFPAWSVTYNNMIGRFVHFFIRTYVADLHIVRKFLRYSVLPNTLKLAIVFRRSPKIHPQEQDNTNLQPTHDYFFLLISF